MAGIIATSITTNNSSSTSADKVVTGYLTGEQITLTTTPVGTAYEWILSSPSGSTNAVLNSSISPSPTFTPDIEGFYSLQCTVDLTLYLIRISTVNVGTVDTIGVLRLQPLSDAQCPTPPAGASLYFSSDFGALAFKRTDGSIESSRTVDRRIITAATYTLDFDSAGVNSDQSLYIDLDRATAQTVTVPPESTDNFPVGSVIYFAQLGAGQTTIAEGAGVTIRNPDGLKLTEQYSTAMIRKIGTNEWLATGDMAV